MEDHHKHVNNNNSKKKNSKSLPVAIQIGGSFGMGGGIVLFGGALVVATVVSAAAIIAYKTRQQHRRLTLKDTYTADANPDDDKELILKSDQDFSHVDSLTLNLHNPRFVYI